MSDNDVVLFLIGIGDGVNFPTLHGKCLIAEATFNGERLWTDPIRSFDSTPQFSTELAWEISHKVLQDHRRQRTPLKLRIYALPEELMDALEGEGDQETDPAQYRKEELGFVMIDIRSAQFGMESEDYQTVNSQQFSRLHPKLNIRVAVESANLAASETSQPPPEAEQQVPVISGADEQEFNGVFRANTSQMSPTRQKQIVASPQRVSSPFRSGIPTVVDDGAGHFLIGNGQDDFVLTVTVHKVSDIDLVVKDGERTFGPEFYISYELFGAEITCGHFQDLLKPQEMAAERATVRIKSSEEELYTYIRQSMPALTITLMNGPTRRLGHVAVDLTRLTDRGVPNSRRNIEDTLTIVPIDGEESIAYRSGSAKPEMVVSASLTTGTDTPPFHDLGASGASASHQQPTAGSPPRITTVDPDDAEVAAAIGNLQGSLVEAAYLSPVRAIPRPRSSTPSSGFRHKRLTENAGDDTVKIHQSPKSMEQVIFHDIVPPPRPFSAEGFPYYDRSEHHFRYGIECREVKDVTLPNCNVYVRYTYPFFGSAAPVITYPPVEVRVGSQHILPNSFCAHTFSTDPHHMSSHFRDVPLSLQLWNRDRIHRDQLMGVAQVNLGEVLSSMRTRVQGSLAWMQTHDSYVAVCTFDAAGTIHKVGEIRVILSLEDFGVLRRDTRTGETAVDPEKAGLHGGSTKDHKDHSLYHQSGAQATAPSPSGTYALGEGDEGDEGFGSEPGQGPCVGKPMNEPKARRAGAKGKAAAPAADVTREETAHMLGETEDDADYDAGMVPDQGGDLTSWRQAQKRAFMRHLRNEEEALTKSLAAEWKKRDRERERTLELRIREYQKLESDMKEALARMESKEHRFRMAEEDFRHKKELLAAEHTRQVSDAREAAKRLKAETDHRLALERSRYVDLREELKATEQKLATSKQRASRLDKEIIRLKDEMANTSQAQMAVTVAKLEKDNAALQKQLSEALQGKLYFQKAHRAAVAELEKNQKLRARELEQRLRDSQLEVDRLKLGYLVREDERAVQRDNEALLAIKRELESIRVGSEEKENEEGTGGNTDTYGYGAQRPDLSFGAVAEVSTATRKPFDAVDTNGAVDDEDTTGIGEEPQLRSHRASLARLLRERESLLKSGVYHPSDRVIVVMDKEILRLENLIQTLAEQIQVVKAGQQASALARAQLSSPTSPQKSRENPKVDAAAEATS
eukprot:Clim_evm8s153 gene=Clim_evmTU8s153